MVSQPTYRHIKGILYISKNCETRILEAEKWKGSGFFNAFTPKIGLDFKKISKYFRNLNQYQGCIGEEIKQNEIQALENQHQLGHVIPKGFFSSVCEPMSYTVMWKLKC